MWTFPRRWSGRCRCWTGLLVISGADGAGPCETLWRLLKQYRSLFLFITKMDQRTPGGAMLKLLRRLGKLCGLLGTGGALERMPSATRMPGNIWTAEDRAAERVLLQGQALSLLFRLCPEAREWKNCWRLDVYAPEEYGSFGAKVTR